MGYRRADVTALRALRQARDRIDRDYNEDIGVAALASEAGYSREHFIRAFSAAYGETPGRYRAEAARRGGPAPIPGCFTLMWETGLPARHLTSQEAAETGAQ